MQREILFFENEGQYPPRSKRQMVEENRADTLKTYFRQLLNQENTVNKDAQDSISGENLEIEAVDETIIYPQDSNQDQ